MPDPKAFIREIHRRSIWQVLAVYGVASWVVLQVVDVLVQNFGLPGWFPAFALALLLVGLPIVLATAVVQEGGPSKESDRDPTLLPMEEAADGPSEGAADRGGDAAPAGISRFFTWEKTLTGGVLAFALWGVVAAGWLVFGGGSEGSRATGAPPDDREMIVVLPFENLGASGDEYFADGITEEITSRLAAVEELGVISRTTAMQYKETDRTLKEIGAELGVDYVLEGTVRWAKAPEGPSQVRVTPQLIRVTDDTHVWSDRYDRELEEIFRIQSEIARRVVGELGAALGTEEERLVDARPTENMEAYDHFLRAQDASRRGYAEEHREAAIAELRKAVELDTAFVGAWAALSIQHSFTHFLGFDHTAGRLRMAKEAVDRALELDPDHPRAHAALGYYHYWGFLDYERALEEFEYASERLPNAADLLAARAYVRRRQGRFEDAAQLLERAFALDPRDPSDAYELGATYQLMRRWDPALRYLDRAIELNPGNVQAYARKSFVVLARTGQPDSLSAMIDDADETVGEETEAIRFGRMIVAGLRRDYERALAAASEMEAGPIEGQTDVNPGAFHRGRILHWMGRTEAARARLDSARVLLEERASETPEDPRVHTSLGLVHAYLGEKDEALEAVRKAVELYPVEKDALGGTYYLVNLAHVEGMVGESDAAVATLERLLSIPSPIFRELLRHDARWDPLRDHEGFQALVGGGPVAEG